jgi:DNA-binding MarR family transcriptional regulator/GNAT superfamily N-acetyltransferase
MATNSLPETTNRARADDGPRIGAATDTGTAPRTGSSVGSGAGDGDHHRDRGDDEVAAVREFTRFYTNIIGLLREGLLNTPYSLTEARVIFELATGGPADATGLRRTLDIDAGYVSRVLARLEAGRIISRRRSPADGRRQEIGLTEQGTAAFAMLDSRSSSQVSDLLSRLSSSDRRRLTGAMATVRGILEDPPRPVGYVLRAPLPGDLGWVIRQHGAVYADEYQWDASFEALVARIVADYAERHDPRREAAWIAEVDGEPAGCVFCVRKSDATAQLRLLLVDPAARGLGIGARLVTECVSFARRAGYTELVLWTNDVLVAARHVYEKAGFELVGSERHHSFGHDLVGQTWRLRWPGHTSESRRRLA